MHFICLRRKFRVAAFNRIFFAWNITTNLFRRVDGGLLFHNAHCSRDAIKLQISRWFLLRDRFASFISLFPAPSFVYDTCLPRSSETSRLLQCIFAFRPSGEIAVVGWKHLAESQYARNVLCIHADRKRKSWRYAPSHWKRQLVRFIVFLLIPRLTCMNNIPK